MCGCMLSLTPPLRLAVNAFLQANLLVCCLTLGSKQNTLVQMLVITVLTIALCKTVLIPVEHLFEWANVFHSHAEDKKTNYPVFRSRLALIAGVSNTGYLASFMSVLRFQKPWARSSGSEVVNSDDTVFPHSQHLSTSSSTDHLMLATKRSTAAIWTSNAAAGLDPNRKTVASWLAATSTVRPPTPTAAKAPTSDFQLSHAIMSVLATCQFLVGVFGISFAIYLVATVTVRISTLATLFVAGGLITAMSFLSFVLIRKSRRILGFLTLLISFAFEIVVGCLIPFVGVKAWSTILIVVGTLHAGLLIIALLLVVKVVRSYKKSQARGRREAMAIATLSDCIASWRTDPPQLAVANKATMTIVKAIRANHARLLMLRSAELRVFAALQPQRRKFLHLVYLLCAFILVCLTFVDLVYIATFSDKQSLYLFESIVGVILYDFFLFDPLLEVIVVGVKFVYNVAHRDFEAVLRDGRPLQGKKVGVPKATMAVFDPLTAQALAPARVIFM